MVQEQKSSLYYASKFSAYLSVPNFKKYEKKITKKFIAVLKKPGRSIIYNENRGICRRYKVYLGEMTTQHNISEEPYTQNKHIVSSPKNS